MSYLLDTCILSKLRKIKKIPDKKLENWIAKHDDEAYFISVLSIGEIQSGISKLNIKKKEENIKKLILENWFQKELLPRFADRICPVDIEVILTWGRILGESQRKGVVFPIVDGLIAATAIAQNLTVVTENIKDFLETGARLYNPWLES